MELKQLTAARLPNSNITQTIEKLSSAEHGLKYSTIIGSRDLSKQNKIEQINAAHYCKGFLLSPTSRKTESKIQAFF
jgi:hypothetical protein